MDMQEMTFEEVDLVSGGALPAMGAAGIAIAVGAGAVITIAAGAIIGYAIYCTIKER
jgi:lactobin A/cerein 7B family class IIb bacteriocin